MKLNFTPQEAFEKKAIKIGIINNNKRMTEFEIPYQLPDIDKWANSVTYPYIRMADFKFDNEGEYIFSVSVDDITRCQESIVAYYGGER